MVPRFIRALRQDCIIFSYNDCERAFDSLIRNFSGKDSFTREDPANTNKPSIIHGRERVISQERELSSGMPLTPTSRQAEGMGIRGILNQVI